jgi:hypothetical protein
MTASTAVYAFHAEECVNILSYVLGEVVHDVSI